MRNIAFIPVRSGSKSIPLKNIREIAGKPLIYWTAKAANDCSDIEKVFIATDSDKIKKIVEDFRFEKVCVVDRSASSATDEAATESVMLEFAQKVEFSNIVLIQATSPLLTSKDIAGGLGEFSKKNVDSVLSVVRQKRFQWKIINNDFVIPVNYDIYHRPRRQEFNGYLVENGAFYITSKEKLLQSNNRISGNIGFYEMDEETYFELDEPKDWFIIEKQLEARMKSNEIVIPKIKMFLTDCDGCLTDGGMYYSERGDELKRFNTLDGMGFQLLRENGILTGIITGEKRMLNHHRAQKLQVDIFEENVLDKLEKVKELCSKLSIDLQNVAYIGDDINDLSVVKAVGFGCCVKNGIDDVKQVAKYVTRREGGKGAMREVADMVIKYIKEQ